MESRGGGWLEPNIFFFSFMEEEEKKEVLETKTGMLMPNSIFLCFGLDHTGYRVSVAPNS